jgi:hypothetical protein
MAAVTSPTAIHCMRRMPGDIAETVMVSPPARRISRRRSFE